MSEEIEVSVVNASTGETVIEFEKETVPEAGHNSVSGNQLRAFIERVERLTEEKQTLQEDIKEVFSEAKGTGFDIKVMRQIIKIRGMDKNDFAEYEEILTLYRNALNME